MVKGIKDFVAEAKGRVGEVTPQEAHDAVAAGRAVLLDVREAAELARSGTVGEEHLHIPRGVLEAKADPQSGAADPGLIAARDERTVLTLCASGARAAMAAARLAEMGYGAKLVTGGFEGWRAAGLPVRSER